MRSLSPEPRLAMLQTFMELRAFKKAPLAFIVTHPKKAVKIVGHLAAAVPMALWIARKLGAFDCCCPCCGRSACDEGENE